ncbi:MAG: sialate O-acetylesterase [Planctomycetota bacterium]|nr:sialate O-acetylesterase [Planctomycetota bacterium]
MNVLPILTALSLLLGDPQTGPDSNPCQPMPPFRSTDQPIITIPPAAQTTHLFILSGQSNMAGLKPSESFTPAVEKKDGRKNVVVVHDAHGGQPIRRWYKKWKPAGGQAPASNGDLYDRLMKKVKSAVDGRRLDSVTLLWMQGERDAREKQAEVYAGSLKGLREQVARDLEWPEVNFVIGRLSDFDMKNARYPHWTRIREIQVQFAKDHPRTAWVDTDDLNDGLNRRGKKIENDLHYSAEGYRIFGNRLAEKAIQLVEAGQQPERQKQTPAPADQLVSLARKGSPAKQEKTAKPDRILPYKTVEKVSLKLHVFQPENHEPGASKPAIVFFFGGGWVGGTPSQFYPQSRYLASRGMVAICAEYRTRSKHKTSPRECVMDGKSAIRFVRKECKMLGIDPKRLAAGGGSAGGHVAAATATVSGFDEPSDPSGISCVPNALVLFNPVYDNSEKGYGHDRVREYWKEISPMHNLSRNTPPTTVFLGTRDKLIPLETAKQYKARMKSLGVRSELHLYADQAHGFFNRGDSFVDTVEKMDLFLISLGYLDGSPSIREKNLAGGKKG